MNGPIRIAFVITELEVGGAERCLVNVATGLDRERFDPIVYSLDSRPACDRESLVLRLEQASVPVRFIGVSSSWQVLSAIRRLGRLLAEQQPHIVQTFLFHANVVGTLAGVRRRPRPCIINGVRVADPSRRRQRLERWVSRRAERIVCVSRSVADFCSGQGRMPREKLVVIPNGINLDQYPAASAADMTQFGVPADRQVVVFVGRLHAQKGVDWLLRVAPRLLTQLPTHDLLLVGDGPDRKTLQDLVGTLGIADRVHFAGWRPDVPQILAASSMLVLPSRWEGMPNVVLEAMATGLPVVSTRSAGVEELLGPLADCQTVTIDDADGFVATVLDLAQDPSKAQEIGRQNSRRAAEHFSLAAMIAAYEQLYESLLTA
ncbi:MAG: glycosyltransferase [Planctomycetes bacterium]|nr:glycosyltransferase [Planctomycetota bacterium]MBL7042616.1 glycosyltransferase [Pirellulaceae bacterium]